MKNVLGDHFDNIELVEADLLDKDTMSKAIEGASYVAHTASPVEFGPEEEVVPPALDGTRYVMEACHKHGVKRCVVTSSTAAACAVDPKDKPANGVWD